jgi:CBS domain-containing protein
MLRLRDIMVTDVLTVSPDMTIREAMDVLVERHISGVPVVANGHVIGIISATDLLAFSASLPGIQEADVDRAEWGEELSDWSEGNEASAAYFAEMWGASGEVGTRQPVAHGPEWNALEEHTVAEAMTSPPLCTLPPNATVEDAAEFMHATGVHRVLVMDSGRLAGIVTSMDVARAVGERRLTPPS